MKRVLLVTIDFPPKIGGVARYYRHILSDISPHSLYVLTDTHSESLSFDQNQRSTIYRHSFLTRWPVWPKWLFLFWHVFWIIKRHHIDFLLVGEVLPTGLVVNVLARWLKIPYIVFTHGLDIRLVRARRRKFWLARRVLQRARYVVANSQCTARDVASFSIDQRKLVVITPGLEPFPVVPKIDEELKTFRTLQGLDQKKCLLSVGRLVERKGFDTVIAALPDILDRFPDLVYVLVGMGPDRDRLWQEVEKRSLGSHVCFIEGATDRELVFWYSICDVFVMVPRTLSNGDVEGFGLVFLEAAFFGKPVIASRSGGVAEAVVDGKTGILIEPSNMRQLHNAVMRLFIDSSFARTLGETGKNRVLQHFSWASRQEALVKLIAT